MITKQEINAMRKADTIVLRHTADRETRIECVKHPTATEKEENPFADTKIFNIGGNVDNLNGDHDACTVVQYSNLHNAIWHTIATQLRAGDEIRFTWYKDAFTSELLREHGLSCDVLFLDVFRGAKQYHYFVDSQHGESDSRYRMIVKK